MTPRQVDVWLRFIRDREPSIRQSVKTWYARQQALKLVREKPKVNPAGVTCLPLKTGDARKQSLYFPSDILVEVHAEAERLGKSLSWVLQQSWTLAAKQMKKFPTIT